MSLKKDGVKKAMIFWICIQSQSSIEEADDLSSDVPLSGLLMSEDSLVGGDDKMAELSGGEDVIGPLLEVRKKDVVVGRDDTALVNAANQLNDHLLAPVVIDDLKLTDVVVLLHDPQEFQQYLWDRLEKDLLFAFTFGIDDSPEGVWENIDLNHFVE